MPTPLPDDPDAPLWPAHGTTDTPDPDAPTRSGPSPEWEDTRDCENDQ